MATKSVLVVLSGGMDSAAVLACYVQARMWRVEAISFDYGQRHVKELDYARQVASHYGVPHKVVNMTSLRELFGASSQTDPSVLVPHGHYAEDSMKKTVVPNRNMIMISIATAWAITRQLDNVAFGAHAGDHAIYPDCRIEFHRALAEAIALCDWRPVRLLAPFIDFTKDEICRMGTMTGTPWHLTWSCYEGGDMHCGKCGTCVERKEAFKLAKTTDPTRYADEPQPLF